MKIIQNYILYALSIFPVANLYIYYLSKSVVKWKKKKHTHNMWSMMVNLKNLFDPHATSRCCVNEKKIITIIIIIKKCLLLFFCARELIYYQWQIKNKERKENNKTEILFFIFFKH